MRKWFPDSRMGGNLNPSPTPDEESGLPCHPAQPHHTDPTCFISTRRTLESAFDLAPFSTTASQFIGTRYPFVHGGWLRPSIGCGAGRLRRKISFHSVSVRRRGSPMTSSS